MDHLCRHLLLITILPTDSALEKVIEIKACCNIMLSGEISKVKGENHALIHLRFKKP